MLSDIAKLLPQPNILMAIPSPLVFAPPTPPSYSHISFAESLLWFGYDGTPLGDNTETTEAQNSIAALFIKNEETMSSLVVLYVHNSDEDLGMCLPFLQLLSKKLNAHILAIEFPGYGCLSSSTSFSSSSASTQEKICSSLYNPSSTSSSSSSSSITSPPTTLGCVEKCAIGAYRYIVRSLGVPPSRIVVWGKGLGASAAIAVASYSQKHPVASLILQSPFVPPSTFTSYEDDQVPHVPFYNHSSYQRSQSLFIPFVQQQPTATATEGKAATAAAVFDILGRSNNKEEDEFAKNSKEMRSENEKNENNNNSNNNNNNNSNHKTNDDYINDSILYKYSTPTTTATTTSNNNNYHDNNNSTFHYIDGTSTTKDFYFNNNYNNSSSYFSSFQQQQQLLQNPYITGGLRPCTAVGMRMSSDPSAAFTATFRSLSFLFGDEGSESTATTELGTADIRKVSVPTLMISGLMDIVVPSNEVEGLFRRCRANRKVLQLREKMGHTVCDTMFDLVAPACAFLSSSLARPEPLAVSATLVSSPHEDEQASEVSYSSSSSSSSTTPSAAAASASFYLQLPALSLKENNISAALRTNIGHYLENNNNNNNNNDNNNDNEAGASGNFFKTNSFNMEKLPGVDSASVAISKFSCFLSGALESAAESMSDILRSNPLSNANNNNNNNTNSIPMANNLPPTILPDDDRPDRRKREEHSDAVFTL